MINDILILLVAIAIVVQGAILSTRYSERVAESFHLSRYIVGFIVVSFISILPETFIAIDAVFQGNSALAIGTIFGSNVADLTLIIALIVIFIGERGIYIERDIARKLIIYPLFLAIPMILGLDGEFSRSEGFALMIIGFIFYTLIFRKSVGISSRSSDIRKRLKNLVLLIISVAILLVGAHLTSSSAANLATVLKVSPALIGVLIVSLGTTIPELSFSFRAVKIGRDSMAIGDILGSVLADVTIVLGLIAVLSPFKFPQAISFIAGGWMFVSSIILVFFMQTRNRIIKKEAIALILFWLIYAAFEIIFGISWR